MGRKAKIGGHRAKGAGRKTCCTRSPCASRPALFALRPTPFAPLPSLFALALLCSAAYAAEPAEGLAARSLPLRAALHNDPSLVAPFERLVALYREANRTGELIELYRTHLARYPADLNATLVLVRLLTGTNDAAAVSTAQGAAARYPDQPLAHYFFYEALRAVHDPGALFALDRAIGAEALFARKVAWLEAFLPQALAADRRDLAEKHLRALASELARAPDGALDLARRMLQFGFPALALQTLEAAGKASPAPETAVEIEAAAASAEVALDRSEAAAARLERLLGRLAPDYWQRQEIVRRRIALVRSEAERQAMLKEARSQAAARPADEAAALHLAHLLDAFELRREALDALLESGRHVPNSARIEKQPLELFDRLRDERGREAYLAERLRAAPDRRDLRLCRAKSLFLLGQRGEAVKELDVLLAALDDAERASQLLDVARFLRASGLASDSAKLLGRLLALAPDRLDVRRELADAHLAAGAPQRLRELFAAPLPKDTPIEALLDTATFLLQQQLYREAHAAAAAGLAQSPDSLDLRLLAASIEARQGNRASGEKLLLDARRLGDTPALYRRWLEAAVALNEPAGSLDDFLEEERARVALERGPWTPLRVERRLAFAEVAARCGQRAEAAQMLRNDLDENPPPDVRLKLRRRLVDLASGDPAQAKSVQEQLQALLKDDPQNADEYRARLAILYAGAFREESFDSHRPVTALLEEIKVTAIRDPGVLAGLQRIYETHLRQPQTVLDILACLTALEPANRAHWERRLALLAIRGDEAALRAAVRRLLAGVEQMPLAAETRGLLQRHLAASSWRSIASLVADGRPGPLAEALALLDSAERATSGASGGPAKADSRHPLWIAWTRAFLLNRLGRPKERDQAIRDLERLIAERKSEEGGAKGDERPTPDAPRPTPHAPEPGEEQDTVEPFQGIVFPDGLGVSLANARAALTSKPSEPARPRPADRSGPLPPLRVQWVFESFSGVPIAKALPLDDARLLVCDVAGGMSCLDRKTGKLLWERSAQGAGQAQAAPGQVDSALQWLARHRLPSPRYVHRGRVRYARRVYDYDEGMPTRLPPLPVADTEGRIYMPGPGTVSCFAAKDGKLLWKAEIERVQGIELPQLNAVLCLHPRGVLAFEPVTGHAAAFHRATGKLLWERALPAADPLGPSWFRSGASLSGDRFLVYGCASAILDATTGEVVWSFDPTGLAKFPVQIKEPEDGPTFAVEGSPATQQSFAPHYAPGGPYWRGGRGGYQPAPPVVTLAERTADPEAEREMLSRGFMLAAPAVAWAAGEHRGDKFGLLTGGQLMLCGPDRGIHILSLDLPVGARTIPDVTGTFIGLAGHIACVFADTQLTLADTRNGTVRTYGLGSLVKDAREPRLHLALDGTMVYATGPEGILCLNAATCERVFQVGWPGGIAVRPRTPPQPLGPGHERDRPNWVYYWQGVVEDEANCVPMANCVSGGTLYATLSPCHLAALVEREAHER
ncbi:MAG: hypothetical protein FJ290_03250 [Planctomycetes bacterium]|nr:hypothetical protein [Planctomycetota bacterium]